MLPQETPRSYPRAFGTRTAPRRPLRWIRTRLPTAAAGRCRSRPSGVTSDTGDRPYRNRHAPATAAGPAPGDPVVAWMQGGAPVIGESNDDGPAARVRQGVIAPPPRFSGVDGGRGGCASMSSMAPSSDTGKSPANRRASVLRHYARLAPVYDRRWARYIDITNGHALRRLALSRGDRLLDVGCGTGALLEKVAHADGGPGLFGLDAVPQMLALARARLPSRVTLCRGRAESLPFANATFDAVACCNMLHYLHRPSLVLAEMRRVLRPGGRVVITDWCGDAWLGRARTWWLRRLHPVARRALRSTELSELLRACGYGDPAVERYRAGCWWTLMSATASRDPQTSP